MKMNFKQPKYNFGLLQTPSDLENFKPKTGPTSSSSSVSVYPSDSSTLSSRHGCRGTTENSFSTPLSKGKSAMRNGNSISLASQTPGSANSAKRHTPKGKSTSNTPYTASSSVSNDVNSSTLVAVVEGRGQARGEIGLTSLDLKQPVLTLSQFSDCSTYEKTLAKLQHINPLEIILPSTLCETGSNSKLVSLINNQFPGVTISSVQRRYFNESKGKLSEGLQYIKHLCAPEYKAIEMQISTKYYCLATTAALLKYVEFIQNIIFAPSSLKAIFKGCEHSTMIDSSTVKNLELLQNLKDPMSQHTLYGILNYTKTLGGGRLLRSNILQPPNDEETIRLRQNAVTELTEKEDVFFQLQSVISKFLDIGHIVGMCIQIPKQESVRTAESKLNAVIMLKHVLQLVAPLKENLSYCENQLLKMFCKALDDPLFEIILTKIGEVINEGTHYQKGLLQQRIQKCMAVKPKINGLLDVARRTYSELVDDLEKRIKTALDEIYVMANVVVSELLSNIHTHISGLYNLADIVSMTDMLLSFAHAATLSTYVCPEFTDTLAIKQSVHPILQKVLTVAVVPNDTYASEHSNFIIITGPNMGGKSTYLRQVALLQIMAQIGSFVPAQYASFRITDQIFSRLGSDDDMESNSSTFTVEMKETNYIMQNIKANSLVIIDELGRGTSAEEGVGICWAISEHMLKTKAFTFFVTHFKSLTDLSKIYPNVANYFFEVQRTYNTDANCEKVSYTHVLSRGITPETHYGLQLAELSTMPSSVIEDAKQIALKIDKKMQKNQVKDFQVIKQHAVFNLATRLIQVARNSNMDEDALRVYLESLRKRFFAETQDTSKTGVQESSSED